ncbi:RING/FYVE/PHD zinc finger superfamily protein [Quillaja saponaria]|uniref:RING/FYVE/PHD zinc finger superfamily protein n=1 Tax=Quillaja saponaria TaxID=32244 RepID=A0AAD7VFY2_QUISA|nr:RING/FYVE/PHD zinc finger superfamily protein [Quillaja saponaria]
MDNEIIQTPSGASRSHVAGPVEETVSRWTNVGNLHQAELSADESGVPADKTECRFCQQEDFIEKMEAPCFCNGTIKFGHRGCVQRWCDTKKDIICEICLQFLAFLVIRDAFYYYQTAREDETISTLSCVLLIILVPCYVMQWFSEFRSRRQSTSNVGRSNYGRMRINGEYGYHLSWRQLFLCLMV